MAFLGAAGVPLSSLRQTERTAKHKRAVPSPSEKRADPLYHPRPGTSKRPREQERNPAPFRGAGERPRGACHGVPVVSSSLAARPPQEVW